VQQCSSFRRFFLRSKPSVAVKFLVILFFCAEGRDFSYHDSSFSWFFSGCPVKCLDITSVLVTTASFPIYNSLISQVDNVQSKITVASLMK
jgi:hypothetical protein